MNITKLVLRAIGCLLLMTTPLLRAADAPKPPPNVLFIAIDDMRDWVGYLGKNPQTITPNLDKLAARGVYFTHSYCAAPVCNPSRAALMSGLRPFTTGVYENNNDWRTVIPADLTITTTFRKAGYYVCGSGKIYHESWARRSEWDDYLEKEGRDPEPTGDIGVGGIHFAPLQCKDEDLKDWRIVDYAIRQLQTKHDVNGQAKPLFLACGLHKPHMPWNVPQKYYDMHPLDKIEIPPHLDNDLDDVPPAGVRMAKPEGDHRQILQAKRWKDAVQGYLAAISYSDAMVGRLIDAFDKSDYRDNTIIVLWSDHGWHLGEKEHWRKFALWEEATRQPFIIVAPGVTRPGGACDRTVDLMCVYPTLCDLCGIPIPKHIESQSIRPLLENPKAEWDKPALMTYRYMNHAVRTADWRYIRYANGDEELYHDSSDPYEWTNLALKPEYAKEKAEMMKLLPTTNHADIGGVGGAEDFGDKKKRKKEGKKIGAETEAKPAGR
jgi:arylsulfatase A-like enzyme